MNLFHFAKELSRYIKPHKWVFLLILICTLLGLSYEAILKYSLKFIIDEVIQNQDKSIFVFLFSMIFIGGVIYTIVGILSDYLLGKYGTVVINQMSSDLFKHIQYLPLKITHKYQIGDVISRFNIDIHVVENGIVMLCQPL